MPVALNRTIFNPSAWRMVRADFGRRTAQHSFTPTQRPSILSLLLHRRNSSGQSDCSHIRPWRSL